MKTVMKLAILTAVALIAFSGLATAAPILCGATPSLPNGTGNGTINCASLDAGLGFHITQLIILRTADASTTLTGLPIVTFAWGAPTFDGAAAGALTFTLTSLGGPGSGFSVVPASPQTNTIAGPNTRTSTAFSITYTSSVAGGTLTSSSGLVTLDFVSAPDAGGVPEPMTMSLMGAGLLAIGIAGRRLRRS